MGYRPEKRFLQFMIAFAAVGLLAIFVTTEIARHSQNPAAVLASRGVRVAFMLLAVGIMWNWYRTRDERQKLYGLQVFALAGAFALAETAALPLMGTPFMQLPLRIAFFAMLANFIFSAFFVQLRRDLIERDTHYALRKALLNASPFIVPLLWWLLTVLFALPKMTLVTGFWIFSGTWFAVALYMLRSKAMEK